MPQKKLSVERLDAAKEVDLTVEKVAVEGKVFVLETEVEEAVLMKPTAENSN